MLNRHNFEIAELAPNDEERLMLCGVHVTPESTSVTDGAVAATVTAVENIQPELFDGIEGVEPVEYFTPFILDRESALKIAKAIPKKTDNNQAKYAVIDGTTENNENAVVSVNDIFRQEILKAKKIPGDFPDISKATPDPERAKMTLLLHPSRLLALCKAMDKFCAGRGKESITMRIYGPGKPIRFDIDGMGQTFTAILMPQKSGDEQ